MGVATCTCVCDIMLPISSTTLQIFRMLHVLNHNLLLYTGNSEPPTPPTAVARSAGSGAGIATVI